MYVFNAIFHMMQQIQFRHLIRVKFLSYKDLDLMMRVSNLLIYPDVIVSNIIHTIGQALATFTKLGSCG